MPQDAKQSVIKKWLVVTLAITVATKLAGRIDEIMVAEGEFVELGQILVRMNVDVLRAQRAEAIAQSKQASAAVISAQAQVTARQSDTAAAIAMVGQRESELDVANRTIARVENAYQNRCRFDARI